MNKKQLATLGQLYNTMLTINTKGEDTIAMSACLQSLYKLIVELNEQGEKEVKE